MDESNLDQDFNIHPFEVDSTLQWNETELDSYINLIKNSTQVDYYAVLNVPKDATLEQIKESYKKLCVTFHPDKHTDPSSKQASENYFLLINKAYQILLDPNKRSLYDLYGSECPDLNLDSDTQVGPLLKTPEQIRAEYEERIRIENMRKLERLISQRSYITATVDASPFLFPEADEKQTSQRKPMKLESLQLKYSTESNIDEGTSMGMIGKMMVQGQRGSGFVRGYAKRSFSRLTNGEASLNLVSWRDLQLKLTHVLEEKSNTLLKADLHFPRYHQPPTLTLHLYRQLLQNRPLLGFVRFYSGYYALGAWGKNYDLLGQLNQLGERKAKSFQFNRHSVSSMTLGVQYTHMQKALSVVSLQKSMFEHTFSVFHQHKLGQLHTLDLAAGLDLVSNGLLASWKWMFQFTEHVKCGLGVQLSQAGTVLVMDWERLGQHLSLPIIVLPEPHLGIGLATTIVALTVTGALSVGVYRPLRQLQRRKALAFLKEQYKDLLLQRQQDAKAVTQLIARTVQKKYTEEGLDGCLILNAQYGSAKQKVDVTIPVMALVEKSVLRMEGGRSKALFIGFYDPCLGEKKELEVVYYFRGLIRKVVVGDMAAVSCPLRSHELVPPEMAPVSPSVKAFLLKFNLNIPALVS